MAPHSSTLAWKIQWWRNLVGCSPWDLEESDTTERLHFHFSLSCIGGGNGNPLQCSCLENPRDGGAWWAAVYGVAQSRTRLKWLRSSSSSSTPYAPSEDRSIIPGQNCSQYWGINPVDNQNQSNTWSQKEEEFWSQTDLALLGPGHTLSSYFILILLILYPEWNHPVQRGRSILWLCSLLL